MVDWRTDLFKGSIRRNQLTGGGVMQGIFPAYIYSATGEDQSGKFIYAGGARSISLPMPFESNTSWIRAIPEGGIPALAAYRADTQDVVCLNYTSLDPEGKLEAYGTGINLYRTLQPGEIEIHSAGLAQSYYSSRPVLEHRGGMVRSWLDQDRLEAGAKAPLHTRFITAHSSNEIGDEERFGVVRRPYNFLFDPSTFAPRNVLSAILALSTNSYNYFDYPFPNYSLPGGVPAVFSVTAQAASLATAPALIAIGEFKQRPFAKERLMVMKNPLFGISTAPNKMLLDFREGQVFDDLGVQIPGPNGAYLRAKYEYHTPFDKSVCQIDEIGNVNWRLSTDALKGWDILIPTGGFGVDALTNKINFSAGLGIDLLAGLSIGLTAITDISMNATEGVDVTAGAGASVTVVVGDYTVTTAAGNVSTVSTQNIDANAGVNFTATAAATASVTAPAISIGDKANSTITLGTPSLTTMVLNANALSAAASSSITLAAPQINIGTASFGAAGTALASPTVDLGAAPVQAAVLGDLLTTWLGQLVSALQSAAPPSAGSGSPAPFSGDPKLTATLTSLAASLEALKSKTIKLSV